MYLSWRWIDNAGDDISSLSGNTIDANIWTEFTLYETEIRNINLSVNGGSITQSTTSNDGQINYNWSLSDDIMYLENKLYHVNTDDDNEIVLPNPKDENYINITYGNYGVASNQEWICLSGCKENNLTFSINETYNISDFCDTSLDTCDVVLGVNGLFDTIPPTCSLSANASTISATYSDEGDSGLAYYGWDSSFSGTNSSSKSISIATHTFYVKDGAGNTNSCSIKVSSVGRACSEGYSDTGMGADANTACFKYNGNPQYKPMDYVCNEGEVRKCPSGYSATGYDADHTLACWILKSDGSCCNYSVMDRIGTPGTMIGTSYCVYK